MLLGLCVPWISALGMPRCQGGSQSPLAFQVACCSGFNQLSFTFPAPDHPKTPVTSPQERGKVPSCLPVLPTVLFCVHPHREVSASSKGQRRDSPGAASLHSTPAIKSLISEAGNAVSFPAD